MDFGITFKGVVRPERARALVRQAENAGFTYCWFYDSHILWRESFVAIAMLMEHTTKMRFGPCVTNPNTRDWSLAASLFGSLALQSGGDSTSVSGAVTARFGSWARNLQHSPASKSSSMSSRRWCGVKRRSTRVVPHR